jgi:hypothetical protein
MTCCIGKARIYYKEPIGFRLIYSGSANGSVTASEPLISECKKTTNLEGDLNVQYTVRGKVVWRYRILSPPVGNCVLSGYSETYTEIFLAVGYGPISGNVFLQEFLQCPNYPMQRLRVTGNNILLYESQGGGNWISPEVLNWEYTIDEIEKYTFKVIGTETGTIYREIGGLEECPAVENLGCVMGEEKHVDTYMGGINGKLLRFIPGFAKIPFLTEYKECIKTKKTNNLFGNPVLNVVKYLEADIPDLGWKDIGFESGILSIPIIEGCPDPPVRVVCCPEGECDPPKCPPDTDCELDCGDFVCCYKNGKVIKTVRK